MRSDEAVPWVRDWLLGCHPVADQTFLPMCADLGLTPDSCYDCPFPACLDDLPTMHGTGIRNTLNCNIIYWRRRVDTMPTALRNSWLIDKIKSWMYQVGLQKSRDIIEWPSRHNPGIIDECRTFVSIMERSHADR